MKVLTRLGELKKKKRKKKKLKRQFLFKKNFLRYFEVLMYEFVRLV
jgi:hypothetical protein